MATLTVARPVFVIRNAVTRRLVTDGHGILCEFMSAPAARLAMRDLALSPRLYEITERED